ncbi:MAG: lipopolysaccharide biosynthesis protein [Bacteroidota bacterium]
MTTDTQKKDFITAKELLEVIKSYYSYLTKKWVIIIIMVILSGIIGYVYASYQKFMYTAELSFVLEEDKGGGGGGFSNIASQFGFDLGSSGGGIFSEGNLMQLMKSRKLVEKTLLNGINLNSKKRTTLIDLYIDSTKMRTSLQKDPLTKNIHFLPNADINKLTIEQNILLGTIYNQIKAKLTVSQRDKKNSIIFISYKCNSEFFAKVFVESLAREVSDFYIETKSKKAKTNVEILQRQADSIRRELNSAISEVASINDKTFNLNSALINTQKVPSTKKQIDVQANSTILSQLVANLEMAKVALRKETPLIQIIDYPTFPLEVKKVGPKKSFVIFGFIGGLLAIISLIGIKRVKEILY